MATITSYSRDITVTAPVGNAAKSLYHLANRFNSDVVITCNGKSASAKCLLMLQTLSMTDGSYTRVMALGADAHAAVERLVEYLGRPI